MSDGPRLLYVMPGSTLHGGIRVILEHAEGMAARGYEVVLASPHPPPDWHPVRLPFQEISLDDPTTVPKADIVIGTFWTTIAASQGAGTPHVFHFCQGWEGVHREYGHLLDRIDATYRLPFPKIVISAHLKPLLEERYGCTCHVLGQSIDSTLFTLGEFRERPRPFRIGVVGPYGIRPKGIHEAIEGFRLAREAGFELEVHHASADPITEAEQATGTVDHFHYRLHTDQMVEFYHRLDGFLHPSHDEEGYPLPPVEAMACGVPVALTPIGGFRVVPDEAALRFPWGEPEAIPPLLAKLTDLETRRRLRAAGLAYVRTLTLDGVLDRLEAAFAAHGAPLARARVG